MITQALQAPEFQALVRCESALATPEQLMSVHGAPYLARLERSIPAQGLVSIDGDTIMSPGSWRAALEAAGAAIAAVEAVLSGRAHRAFCAVRPPGHHAEPDVAMGFCLFNNIAVAAKHALEVGGLQRVAIIDFDVHHGNGTETVARHDPRLLYISSHQSPLYPGTGTHAGFEGNNILNLPLPAHSDGAAMQATFQTHALPALRAFEPELVFISAGFDAHAADPLANLRWHETDYAWLTTQLCILANECAKGRVVSCLEGGYHLSALASSVAAHVNALMETP